MTITEIQQSLEQNQPKPKPAPRKKAKADAPIAIRPADTTAQRFAQRVRIIIEDTLGKPADYKMGLEFILRMTEQMTDTAPAAELAEDRGLRHNAERIVKALEITDLTPTELVAIVERSEMVGV
jgi:hypothetical protein